MNLERAALFKNVRTAPFFAKGGWTSPTDTRKFGNVNWRPDYVCDSGVMCLLSAEHIPVFLRKRILAAANTGYFVTCVTDLEVLSEADNVALLSQVDSKIIWVRDDGNLNDPRSLLKVLAEEEVAVDPNQRVELIRKGLERCGSAVSNDDKGKRLEQLLHFMFSQIRDFRVLKCNWRTQTEELDCVIQVRSMSGRSWSMLGAPHIIVEAKNRAAKTGQESVSKLRSIMDGKRKTCRIGILVSLSGFTSDASNQVLRYSTEENIFVLLAKQDLEHWSKSSDFESGLEDLINAAMLD